MWNVKSKVIPIVTEATGRLSRSFEKYLDETTSKYCSVELRRTIILGTAHILRKFKRSNFFQVLLCNEPQRQGMALIPVSYFKNNNNRKNNDNSIL
jgi:hypothetical protein